MKTIIYTLIFAFLISSCSHEQSKFNDFMEADMELEEGAIPLTMRDEVNPRTPPPPPVQASSVTSETKVLVKKKIIKDGRIGIEVKELEITKAWVDSLIAKFDGYYANERLNNSERETSYSLKIRIPSGNFELLIANIETGKGEIKYKEIDARDVTSEFIDLETRLDNKRNYLKKYTELLKKANSIKDILDIEEKIRGIEEEIESTTGRLKYLSNQVNFSTLDLEISEPKDYKYQSKKRDNFAKRIKYSLSKGWLGLIDFIVFIIRIWPFWIILGLAIYGWRRRRRKKHNKK